MHKTRSELNNHLLISSIFFLSLFFDCNVAAAIDDYAPQDYMRCAVEEITAILSDDRLSKSENFEERRQLMLAVVRHHFDFQEMSKRTLAQAWKKLSGAEKREFVDIFSQLLQNTYVKRVEAYSDEEVVFLSETVKGRKSAVETAIQQNDLEIPITYKLIQKEKEWLVYDVVIEGVSLVQNYRTQFRSIIRKEKYAGLLVRLEDKLEKIKTGSN